MRLNHSYLFIAVTSFCFSFSSYSEEVSIELGLVDAIHLALKDNLTLARGNLLVDRQENDVQFAKAAYQPSLDASISLRERSYAANGEPVYDGLTSSESVSGSLSLGYNLIDGGTKGLALEQARFDLQSSMESLNRSRQQVLYQVVSQYLGVLLRQRTVEIRTKELQIRKSDLERIKLDYKQGVRIRSDVFRQEAQVAETQRVLVDAERAMIGAQLELKRLLDLGVGEDVGFPNSEYRWLEESSLDPPNVQVSLSRLDNRPDIIAQNLKLSSVERSVRMAERANHFKLNASASVSSTFSNNGRGYNFTQQFVDHEPELNLGLTMSVPILDRRRTETNQLRSHLELNQEKLNLHEQLQLAENRIYLAAQDFHSATARLAASRLQLTSIEEALRAEEVRFGVGDTTLLDLNTLRNSRLSAALSVEQSLYDLFDSRLELSFQDGSVEAFLLEQTQIRMTQNL